jgi:condensin complex subunit 1
LLAGAVQSVAESSENITDPETFDIIRSFLKNAASLQGSAMSKILDSLSSGLAAQATQAKRDVENETDPQVVQAHRIPLEMYAFLLSWFVDSAEKVKSSGEDDAPAPKPRRGRGGKAGGARGAARKDNWSWEQQIPTTLRLITRVLVMKFQRIWTTVPERDAFVEYVQYLILVHDAHFISSCITRPAYHLWESEIYMKSAAIRGGIFSVIHLAVKNHGHALRAQIKIVEGLAYHEHLSEPMAECLDGLVAEYQYTQLGEDVLREIASKTFSGQDTKSPRFFSRFLIAFAEKQPKSVLKQISLLLGHLDSEVISW